MRREQMKVGTMIVKILNEVSPLAAIGALVFMVGGFFEFRTMSRTLAAHCAREAMMATKADLEALHAMMKDQYAKQEASIREVETRREQLAKAIEEDRRLYSDKQERRDTAQDHIYLDVAKSVAVVSGQVQTVQSRLETIAEDVSIIKQLHMKTAQP